MYTKQEIKEAIDTLSGLYVVCVDETKSNYADKRNKAIDTAIDALEVDLRMIKSR